ncbi:MAG: 30S ribosomal protein S8 [Gammaproteobacteria bacterium]
MSMQDPISDMLTRIRNAGGRKHPSVLVPSSKHKKDLLRVLLEQGYVNGFHEETVGTVPMIHVSLKYYHDRPVISKIARVSRPSLRKYAGAKKIRPLLGGLGCYIVSTSKGLMTDRQAKQLGVGGEIICMVA